MNFYEFILTLLNSLNENTKVWIFILFSVLLLFLIGYVIRFNLSNNRACQQRMDKIISCPSKNLKSYGFGWKGQKIEFYQEGTRPEEKPASRETEAPSPPSQPAPKDSPVPIENPSSREKGVSSPLDQFEIIPLMKIQIGDFYFSFTNSSLFMLLTLSLVLILLYFVTKKGGGNLVPNAWQSLVEFLYDFVLNLVKEQMGGLSGKVKEKFFPCILVTFLFLLFCNLQGMIPYSFTVTSHFIITLGLSFSLFLGITLVGFKRNGLHFLSFSLPAGVPLPLAPFLVLLELISYCFRALSSGIRLFANMMAGHSSVKILSGFAWTMLCMNDLFYFIGDPGPFFIVLALTGLELGVAISQAHVSTILICIYLNDATNLHQSPSSFIIFFHN